jgi:hypothetical protein
MMPDDGIDEVAFFQTLAYNIPESVSFYLAGLILWSQPDYYCNLRPNRSIVLKFHIQITNMNKHAYIETWTQPLPLQRNPNLDLS